MKSELHIIALQDVPLVKAGDRLDDIITVALQNNNLSLDDGDVLVLAQKIVSKAEARSVDLDTVEAGTEASSLAAEVDKDPRLVELILSESKSIVRKKTGVLITEHRLGWIMANAGIDASNVERDNHVLLLPVDADKSCAKIRERLESVWQVNIGVVVNDSFGRPWRLGTTGIALGASGIPSLWDRRGETDLFGRELRTTQQGIADELSSAASLLQGQGAEGRPIVLIRGLELAAGVRLPSLPATALIRDKSEDMFR